MEPETNTQKFKNWAKTNAATIAVYSTATAVVGAYAWLVWTALKEQNQAIDEYNQYADEMNQWITDERNEGNAIYAIGPGEYLVIPNDGPQKFVRK